MTVQGTYTPGDAAARDAARRLMQDPKAAISYEPTSPSECHAAVDELAAAFSAAGETFKEMVDNSRGGAESLSTDSFQGLSEIVQNANDAGATRVAFTLNDSVLEVQHNGRPVDLRDLRAMSVPWLTTKSDDPDATGRFGVGLSTLHAVAQTFEVHSGDYHVRIGDPFLTNLDEDPREEGHSSETILRVVFREGAVSEDDFLLWCDKWDDAALVFMTSVREVSFATSSAARTLHLDIEPSGQLTWSQPQAESVASAKMSIVSAPDGRRWLLASREATSPEGVERTRKRKGETTPLGIALPLYKKTPRDGYVYAGLPVVGLPGIPVLVNAQFDPVTARQGLLGTAWNFALSSLVDDLWSETIKYLFEHQPKKAWRCVPISPQGNPSDGSDGAGDDRDLVSHLGSGIRNRSTALASTLVLDVDGDLIPLADLAVESQDLTGLLTDDEVVDLAGAAKRLPDVARDGRGRWREVLRHWRGDTLELPREITIRDALRLLDNPVRPVRDVIRLAAVAVDSGLGTELLRLNCVLDDDGSPHQPPSGTSAFALTPSRIGLASDLGLAIPLHPEYLADDSPAKIVCGWLRASECMIDADSDMPILDRLAAAGAADQPVEEPFNDGRLKRLRVALEALDSSDLHRLGQGIGQAIFLDGYEFASDGTATNRPVRPCDAYLPKRIETLKDGFFTAAGETPGLVWITNRYVDVLKSALPRGAGLGPQKFLKALGVATAPRIVKHAALDAKYRSSRKKGLPIGQWNAPPEWRRALSDLEADHTLEDWDSPDLIRVLTNIAADNNARRRRDRANAVIETLGRAWRDLGDAIEVDAAWAMNQWNVRGPIRAFWLWRAASIPWLDNAEGAQASPLRLRRRSTANIAVFGDTPETFLHKDVLLSRPEVLNYLGISREPSTSDLIRRLRALRENSDESTYAECATVYVALASRAAEGSLGRTARQLREQLAEQGGLVRTPTSWVSPSALLRGLPIFGQRREFTPNIPGAERLWRFLQIPEPRIDDCLAVLGEIAKTPPPVTEDDEATVLQTLRRLDTLLGSRRTDTPLRGGDISNRVKTRLGSLPLWTSQGWANKRPIYVAQDPQLIDGIGDTLPIWTPGADPAQFKNLFALLKLTPIGSSDVAVNHPDRAYFDDDATGRFQRGLAHFKADLARNAPETERSLTVPWSDLQAMEVRVHPMLEATVTPTARQPITIAMHAKFEPAAAALFLRDDVELDRVDGVGRALAALFTADERNLAYTWLAAVQKEREGQRVHALELASERRARETQDAQDQMDRLRDLQVQVKDAAAKKSAKKKPANSPPQGVPDLAGGSSKSSPRKPLVLVDIDSLLVTDAAGEIVNEGASSRSATRSGGGGKANRSKKQTGASGDGGSATKPTEPDKTKGPPKPSSTYRAFSDGAKERLGLKIASRVLAGDAEALIDIRNQRNVGADAIDDLGRFYELKVFGTDEGDTITLEPSQIARAMSEPQFFLVIVSNLIGENARPKVRVIVDPLRQLSMAKESKVKFSGLQEARGLVFNLDNATSEPG